MVCKTDLADKSLAEQLKEHSITRKYEAIVYNNFSEEEGVIERANREKSIRPEEDGRGTQKRKTGGYPLSGAQSSESSV